MILSRSNGFVFVKTQKTAGTSVEIALRRYTTERDVITPISPEDEAFVENAGIRGPQLTSTVILPLRDRLRGHAIQLFRRKRPVKNFVNHHSAAAIAAYFPEEWSSFHTFSVMRNPWDAAASMLWFRRQHWKRPDLTVDELLDSWSPHMNWEAITIHGEVAVDEVLQFHRLSDDLNKTLARCGISYDGWLPHAKGNTGRKGRHHRDVLEERHIERIALECAPEIAAFGYTPDES